MKTGTLTPSKIELGSSSTKIENVDGYLKFTDGYNPGGVTFNSMTSTAGSWVTAYDVDFSTQTPQTFSSDTTYTIDGKTWNIINKANANTFDIGANGIGGTANGGGLGWTGAVWLKSAPMAYIQLTQLVPNLDMTQGIRASVYISTYGGASSWESVFLVLAAPYANIFDKHFYISKSGASTIYVYGVINTSGGQSVAQTNSGTNNMLVLEVDKMNSKFCRGYSAAYVSDWADIKTWVARPEITATTAISSAQTAMTLPADVYLYLIGQNSDTVASMAWRIKRLRVQYKI